MLWSECLKNSRRVLAASLATALAGAAANAAPPANDTCANAIAITAPSTTLGTLNMATPTSPSDTFAYGGDCGTEDGRNQDVWYSLSITTPGVYTIGVSPTDVEYLDKGLAVQVFTACGGTQLACQRRVSPINESATVEVSVYFVAGTYRVRVAVADQLSIDFTHNGTAPILDGSIPAPAFELDVSAPSTPVQGDVCSNPIALTPGTDLSSSIRPTTGGLPLCSRTRDWYDLWFSFTAPTSGPYRANVKLFTPTAFGLQRYLTVFHTGDCAGTPVFCGELNATDAIESLGTLSAGNYLLRVSFNQRFANNPITPINYTARIYPPARNDACANAASLVFNVPYTETDFGSATPSFDHDVTLCFGVDDAGYTEFSTEYDRNDLWYSFQAPANGYYQIRHEDGDNFTRGVISLFSSCGGSPYACIGVGSVINVGDPASAYTQAISTGFLAAGQTVWVRYSANPTYTQGVYTLVAETTTTPTVPPNDLCMNAIPVDVGTSFTLDDFRGATLDPLSQTVCSLSTPTYGVWYKTVMPGYGILQLRTEPGQNNNRWAMAAFAGDNCGNLTPIPMSGTPYANDCRGVADSTLSSAVRAGKTVYFLVGTSFHNQPAPRPAPFTFQYTATTPPTGGCCVHGACQIQNVLDCESMGGTFFNDETCTQTFGIYDLNDTAKTIRDNRQTIISSLIFADDTSVSNMVITVNITHAYADEIKLYIDSSVLGVETISYILGRFNADGSCVADGVASNHPYQLNGTYIFDESAPTSVKAAILALPSGDTLPPGRYRPDACPDLFSVGLHVYDGFDVSGRNWSLISKDYVAGNPTGIVTSWSLGINGGHRDNLCFCSADFNHDHARDVADLFGYINAWLAKTANADFNHDNVVDVADLFGFINAWLAGC